MRLLSIARSFVLALVVGLILATPAFAQSSGGSNLDATAQGAGTIGGILAIILAAERIWTALKNRNSPTPAPAPVPVPVPTPTPTPTDPTVPTWVTEIMSAIAALTAAVLSIKNGGPVQMMGPSVSSAWAPGKFRLNKLPDGNYEVSPIE
jgi:heme A synthase